MQYGYVRPITSDRLCQNQLIKFSVDQLYKETHGLSKRRKELEKVLMMLQKGDDLYIQSIVVLADSLQQLLDVLRLAERDQITIHFIDEQLTNLTIQKNSFLQSTTFFVGLQSIFLSHSSTFSLQNAKEQGKTIGRPRKPDANLQRAFTMYDSKEYTLYDIKEVTGISKSTLYRYLDDRAKPACDDT